MAIYIKKSAIFLCYQNDAKMLCLFHIHSGGDATAIIYKLKIFLKILIF